MLADPCIYKGSVFFEREVC